MLWYGVNKHFSVIACDVCLSYLLFIVCSRRALQTAARSESTVWFLSMYMNIYIYICTNTYIYIYTYIYIPEYIYIYMYTHVYISIYIYIIERER